MVSRVFDSLCHIKLTLNIPLLFISPLLEAFSQLTKPEKQKIQVFFFSYYIMFLNDLIFLF